MKKYVTRTVKKLELSEVYCNKCGKKFDMNSFTNEFAGSFGYGTKYDGQLFQFDLCDDCTVEVINTFKIKEDVIREFKEV